MIMGEEIKGDKSIDELLKIKGSLDSKTQQLFNDLTASNKSDPFTRIFGQIREKNQQLRNLRLKVAMLEDQLREFRVNDAEKSTVKSQPSTVVDTKLTQNALNEARKAATMSQEASIEFQLFLIKVIYELSTSTRLQSDGMKQRDLSSYEIPFKLRLSEVKQIFGQQFALQKSKKFMPNDSSENNFENIIKELEEVKEQDLFQRISTRLGIQDRWRKLIDRFGKNEQHFKTMQEDWQNYKVQNCQIFLEKSKMLSESREQISLRMESVPEKTFEGYLQEKEEKLKKESEECFNKCSEVMKEAHEYFFISLEKLLKKHNLNSRLEDKSIVSKHNWSKSVQNGSWDELLRLMIVATNQRMYAFDRRIKFNSNNRLVALVKP